MAQKRPVDDSSPPSQFTYRGQTVYRSSPIHDRSSIFVAIYSSSVVFLSSPQILQQYPGFEDAMHRIVAWRRRSNQLGLGFGKVTGPLSSGQADGQRNGRVRFETGSDEDGEKYAGRKVEKVLESEEVEGVVVVARWYGGILLGPVRFKWIEDCAREVIKISRGQLPGVKKVKVDADARGMPGDYKTAKEEDHGDESQEKQRLIKVLAGRDESIDVLRTLLAAKIERIEGHHEAEVMSSQSPDVVTAKDAPKDRLMASGMNAETKHSIVSTIAEQSGSGKEPSIQTDDPRASTPASNAEHVEGTNNSKMSTSGIEPIAKSLPNYAGMSLPRLKQLERARDATIRWILKQLDVAEEKLQQREEANYKKVKVKAEEIRRQERREEQRRLSEQQEKGNENKG